MNDPHVSALLYRVKHSETINYDKAEPLEYETATFRVSIQNNEARFEMKNHFPTAEGARGSHRTLHLVPIAMWRSETPTT
jgi:hypothetical protein